jgi:putative copper export protein
MSVMLLLRLIHIVGGAYWVGSLVFFAVFLEPIMRAAGPEGGRMMGRVAGSKFPTATAAVAILTILTGLAMYMKAAMGSSDWMKSGFGMTLGLGGAAAITAFLLGFFISRPAAARMGRLSAQLQGGAVPPSPEQAAEIGRLRGRLVGTARIVAALLLFALACMAVARYIG